MPSLNEVEHLRNMVIKVPEEDLGELEEDEFYFHEIIRSRGCVRRRGTDRHSEGNLDARG